LFMIALFTGLPLEIFPNHHKYMNEVREFRVLCQKIIQDRKANTNKGTDMLGLIFDYQKTEKDSEKFNDKDIVDEFITFFIAGMDTTALLCTITLYLLSKHPEYLERVKKEAKEIYSGKSPVTIEDLNDMEFTHAVLKEALRMYSPATSIIPRIAQFDHEIGDIKIKKGTGVQVGFAYNNSNEKNFKDPSIFNPDRWLNKKGDMDTFTFIPFSAGQRNCIGQHLALIEAKVIIAEFLNTFEYKVVPDNFKLKMGSGFLYRATPKIQFDVKLKN